MTIGRRPLALELFERHALVEQCLDERVHVVGATWRLRQQCMQVGVARLGLRAVEMALLAEQSDQPAAALVGIQLVVGDDVAHPGLLVVCVRTAEGHHVDVLAGDAAHHVGAGDEHLAVRRHHDDVGQRRSVRGAAGGKADDDRDLRDVTRRPDHGLEDQTDGMQRLHAFGQSGATRVPDADDRALLLDRGVVGVDDVRATLHTHGAAHDGAVGAERDGAHAVDGPGRGQHAGAVTLVKKFDGVGVEESAQAQQRIAWIERFADSLGGHDGHVDPPVALRISVFPERERDVVPTESE